MTVRFWASVSIAGVFVAIMGNTALIDIMPRIPLINMFRAHGRALLLFSFAFSVLAAFGLERVRDDKGLGKQMLYMLLAALASASVYIILLKGGPPPPSGVPADHVGFSHPEVWPQMVLTALYAVLLFMFTRGMKRRLLYGIICLMFVELFVYGNQVKYGVREAGSLERASLCQEFDRLRLHTPGSSFRIARMFEEAVDYRNLICQTEAINPHEPLIIYDFGYLFELEPTGISRYWENLIKGNSLISILNVRYIMIPRRFRAIAESTVIGKSSPAPSETVMKDTRTFELGPARKELKLSIGLEPGSYIVSAEVQALEAQMAPLKMDVYTARQNKIRNTLYPFFMYPGMVDERPDTYYRIIHLQSSEDVYVHFRSTQSMGIRIGGIDIKRLRGYGPPRINSNSRYAYRYLFKYGDYLVYENMNALPRAYSVGNLRHVRDIDEVKRLYEVGPLDPTDTALLSKNDLYSIGRSDFSRGEVEITEYDLHTVRIRTRFDGDGFLVLGDQAFPGWKAYAGGEELRIFTVNGFSRGVVVPKGTREVVFVYRPKMLIASSALSLAVVAACIGGLLLLNSVRSRHVDIHPDTVG
jgi:hypothetical protein